jgi:hypothetical protein
MFGLPAFLFRVGAKMTAPSGEDPPSEIVATRLFNGAKSTLAMFHETNLVWTVLRAIGGIRNAVLQVRS